MLLSGKAGQASPGCRWVEPASQQLEGGGSVFDDGDAAVKRRVWVEGRGPGFVLDFVKWRVVASKHMIEFEYELSTERRKSGSAGAEVEPAAVVLDRKANNGLRWLVEVLVREE